VTGPILTTRSAHDRAVNTWYPWAAGVANQVEFAPPGELPRYGLGVTNIVARPTRAAAELSTQELRDGAAELAALVARWRPRGGAVGRAGACGVLHAAEFEGFASSMPSNRGAPG